MYLSLTHLLLLLLATFSPILALPQAEPPSTDPVCTDTNAARLDYTFQCGNALAQDPTAIVDVSSGRICPCYRITRGRTDITEVVVMIRPGHEQGGKYTTTKGDVACAVRRIASDCKWGGNRVGGMDGVCNEADLMVVVEGEGN